MATTTAINYRRGRLEGKVCIVTGVGSPIGIGCVIVQYKHLEAYFISHTVGHQSSDLEMKVSILYFTTFSLTASNIFVGARHIYALDLDGTNFAVMGAEFQAAYPRTKVSMTNTIIH